MNVLVLGSGGREHALSKKLSESPLVRELYVMPGNPGISSFATTVKIDPMKNQNVLIFCKDKKIDLVIPGSEVYLENGITDILTQENIYVFGPTKEASQIESSKSFAKRLMKKYDIPTATYEVFADYDDAVNYIGKSEVPIVIKYDGLAGGKGVVVAFSKEEAISATKTFLVDKLYGNGKIIIEEFLEGPEFSLMCFVDNGIVVPMPISQDHKRLEENDKGPNTGGMGIYSPVPIISDSDVSWSVKNIMEKTVLALVSEGIKYTGFLYGGLMLTKHGPKVIEFNARFGDPEAEVLMPKLKSDILEIILDLKNNKVSKVLWSNKFVLGVVLASKGYPIKYEKNHIIKGVDTVKNIYHMGTKFEDNKLYTNGGRVLFVYGEGDTLLEAKNNAYESIKNIKCNNLIYRKDIGYRSFSKEEPK